MMNNKKTQFARGVTLFNQGRFYESHEEWEGLWLKEEGADRDFLQGLIIAAGGFHHLKKTRADPAQKAFKKALAKLGDYPAHHYGINLGLLRDEIQEQLNRLPTPHYPVIQPA